ncbi:inositol monophosphatase 1-like isoform X1 [Apis dorsata]|uniref:inositol monophosphatase 1-like isoform X1 n=1 Tax=Apis dorsata TaxID=7462 RepID=UPI0012933039|nr:inositol monophosphatase 1-like isoform X1 [Apis dorsata]
MSVLINLCKIEKEFQTAIVLAIISKKSIIKSAINLNKNVKSKGIDWDLVTEYDRKIENDLQKELLNKYPNHRFIGEETTAEKNCLPKLTDEPTWIIDPIDGTTNFVHQFPHTCISLALIINKSIEIGIVYNPLMMQFFSAKRQKGAFLNGHRIKTSKITDLSESLIAMEPWIAKNPNYLVNIYTRMHALIQRTHGIRSLGTAALTLCYVAMGAIEAYHVESIDAWDVAAGKLIIEEAGGTVIDTAGGELDLITPRVIAACNYQIADQLVNLFKTADLETVIKNILNKSF